MTIKQFIEKAIEGGWGEFTAKSAAKNDYIEWCIKNIERALLDPDAWKAVGKVEGWDDGECNDETYKNAPIGMFMWTWKMHQMTDALCEGKSIEEFLRTL